MLWPKLIMFSGKAFTIGISATATNNLIILVNFHDQGKNLITLVTLEHISEPTLLPY